MIFLDSRLCVRHHEDRGWGIYATDDIESGTIIECSPVILMPPEQRILLDKTRLHDYIFEWGPDHSQCIMAMGYIPIYNHRCPSNAEYEMDYDEETISIVTQVHISSEEEIFINYHGDYDIEAPLWFDPK